MRLPIRWKLVLAIGLPLLAIYGAVLIYASVKLNDRARAELTRNFTRLAAHYADEFDGRFQTLAQVARSTASVLRLNPKLGEKDVYDLLAANVQQSPLIYGSCLAFEPNAFSSNRRLFGPYVCRSADGLRSADLGGSYDYTDPRWDWYHIPRQTLQAFWTEPYFDEGGGNIIMCTYSAPIIRDDHLIGIATIDLPLADLQKAVLPQDFQGASFAIISRNGTIISHPDPSLIMHETIFTQAQKLGRPELETLGRRMLAGESGASFLRELNSNDMEWLFFAPIPSAGWTFVASIPDAQAMAFVRQQQRLGIGLMLMGLLLITLMLLLVSSRITKPIARLAAAVGEISAGNLGAKTVDIENLDEIGDLARSFNQMVKDLRAHVAALTKATAARERVESELRVARDIQTSLLPRTFPPFPDRAEFDLHAVNAPARTVAGDFFDFFFIDDDTLLFVIADVSGKGVPAAMFMAVTRTILRNLAERSASPGQMLSRANQILLDNNESAMFVTLFMARYEVSSGRLRYANAGHPPPYLVRADGRVEPFGRVTGTVLGVVPDEQYEEDEGHLEPGQRLVLFTDGVTEARSPNGDMYLAPRLEALLARFAGQPVLQFCAAVIEEIDSFQNHDPADDITLMIIQRNR